jgi:diaminopimelate decarboxylase
MFEYRNNQLYCEDVPAAKLANQFGTPLFVYSKTAITQAYQEFVSGAQGHSVLVCYGMKANSNLGVLKTLAHLGAGFDIVSGGELAKVLLAGGQANKIVFSGVGKTTHEIEAALQANIKCFNVESEAELDRIQGVAKRLNLKAPISLRINPEVDAKTHAYISTGLKENKFGVEHSRAVAVYQYAATLSHLKIVGIDCHIGSQITEAAPFLEALDKLIELVQTLSKTGILIEHIDVGGGLGIDYNGEQPLARATLVRMVVARVTERLPSQAIEVVFEIGRSMVGNAGVLLTQVEFLKKNGTKHFAVVDAAMNDLLRPSLYGAFHRIEEVNRIPGRKKQTYDVVGPVCESGDWLGKDRSLGIEAGDFLAVGSAGAYAMSMSSNYNTRNRAAEVMVNGNQTELVRRRETYADQWRSETDLG